MSIKEKGKITVTFRANKDLFLLSGDYLAKAGEPVHILFNSFESENDSNGICIENILTGAIGWITTSDIMINGLLLNSKVRKISYKQYLTLVLNQAQRKRPEVFIDDTTKRSLKTCEFVPGNPGKFVCGPKTLKSKTPGTKAVFLGVDLGGDIIANSTNKRQVKPEPAPSVWLQIQHDFALNCGDNLKAA